MLKIWVNFYFNKIKILSEALNKGEVLNDLSDSRKVDLKGALVEEDKVSDQEVEVVEVLLEEGEAAAEVEVVVNREVLDQDQPQAEFKIIKIEAVLLSEESKEAEDSRNQE